MITREITKVEEFECLNDLIRSQAEDYREMLFGLMEVNESPYSIPYAYSRLLLFKADFERTLLGLRRTSLLLPIYEKLNGQWLQFYAQKEQLRHQLNEFLRTCQQDEALQQKIKAAGDEVDANITVEKYRTLIQLHHRQDVDSLNVHSTLATIDNLYLLLDERKSLGLQYIFELQRDQKDLELVFGEIEQYFWENLSILRRFRSAIKEHREGFLILDEKKYPWWYPEKRKMKVPTTYEK